MRGFHSAVERTRRFTTHAFHEGRKVLGHIDRGLTTAAHIYHHVAPVLAPLATRHLGVDRAQMTHDLIFGVFALQANQMANALHQATKKRTPEL